MKHLKNIGQVFLACGLTVAGIGLLTLTVKICWTLIEFTWGMW